MRLDRIILLLGVALSALSGLGGCSGMSEQMSVGFVKGMRAVPASDFTPGEKERVLKVKSRFETLFEQGIKKKLEQRGLEGLKGWMVLLRFQSDGFTKTASLSLYTYWGQEERHDVYAVPLERFLDESQTVELADKATEEVMDYLSQKAGSRQTLLADPR
ncbi:MAG TPA: hypothetical protein ACFYD5_08265 [Candidatus Tripitaka sp. YC43]